MLFQWLCRRKLDWDKPLSGEPFTEWEQLTSNLQRFAPIKIPWCYVDPQNCPVNTYSPQGYCDAFQRAYAAIVYLQVETGDGIFNQFLCSRPRWHLSRRLPYPDWSFYQHYCWLNSSPCMSMTCLAWVWLALEPETQLHSITCYTDSQVALSWIVGRDKEWKQFVQNRVTEIKRLVPVTSWKHCPGIWNPADIPSRGASPAKLQDNLKLWLCGPHVLPHSEQSEKNVCADRVCKGDEEKGQREADSESSSIQAAILLCEEYS